MHNVTAGEIPALATDRLDLVPLDPERDAESLHRMLADPEVFRFDEHAGPAGGVAETRARLEGDLAESAGRIWSIRLRPSLSALGTIGLFSDRANVVRRADGVTAVRGLSWRLCRDHWGHGIMGEAARRVVEHLLAQPGIDALEAWIDSENTRSLGVARRAGLDERSRLPRVYRDHVGQQVVMARAATLGDPDTFAVRPGLAVRDVPATAELLSRVLGLHILFLYGDPPSFGRLGVGPWADSPGLELRAADDAIVPARVSADIGVPVDTVYERVLAAGLEVAGSPHDCPWHRREFEFFLPEGHHLRIIGPLNPGGGVE